MTQEIKNLGTLDSLKFFCANGTCRATECRCDRSYAPKLESVTLFIKFRRLGVFELLGIIAIFAALLWWFGK